MRADLTRAGWAKSSFSNGSNNCVQVARLDGTIYVRDSKLGDGSPVLAFTPSEWAAFVTGVEAGELRF
jgi:hypothetical protein